VLSKTYGALADLRRELSDSKAAVNEREELLNSFASCADSQRAWLLLEDYFEKHALSRKDFPATDWWPRVLCAQGKSRLEELAFLFLRAKRSMPTELSGYANLDRFAQVEQAAQEQQIVKQLEEWLFPPKLTHLDSPRASLRVVCQPEPDDEHPSRYRLSVQFHLMRPRAGERIRTLREIIELTTRAAHALIRRGNALLIYDADSHTEHALPGIVDKYPQILVNARFALVSPLLVNIDSASVVGQTKQRALALSSSGQLLTSETEPAASGLTQGPLHWLTPALSTP